MAVIDQVNKVFDNASRFQFQDHVINPGPEIRGVHEEVRLWLRQLEEDRDASRKLRLLLWRLRSAAVMGLLPFGHPDAFSEELLDRLVGEGDSFPVLRERRDEMKRRVNALRAAPGNPKLTAILRLINGVGSIYTDGVGLVWSAQGTGLPGWSQYLDQEVRGRCARLTIIGSARQLTSECFSVLILPWGGHRCPFLREIYDCMRAPRLHVIRYDFEHRPVADRPLFRLDISTPRAALPSGSATDTVSGETAAISDGDAAGFWDSLRASAVRLETDGPDAERQVMVTARLVLFQNGQKAFLRENLRVLEVSSVLEAGNERKIYQRVPVAELSAGDLVVLRTTGGQDFLLEVADRLMTDAGVGDLRRRAFDWKPLLAKALEEIGSEEFVSRLARRGHGLKSGHAYIWYWTTSDFIRPESEAMFYEMMAILEELGFNFGVDALAEAKSRWNAMGAVRRFHLQAGQVIRRLLMGRLKEYIVSGAGISTELRLTLPQSGAGELAVLRVSDVDHTAIQVPFNMSGVLMDTWD